MRPRSSFFPLAVALFVSCVLAIVTPASGAEAEEVKVTSNVLYKTGESLNAYDKERGSLDVYAPAGARDLPVLVWFYGGGLTEGEKSGPFTANICRALAGEGMVVVCPDYRLYPKVKYPAYLEDAAEAVAWTRRHAAEYGGNPARVFVGGHSAGGYLTLMLGVDARFLEAVHLKPTDLAGFIPISGQTMTHYTVREERGLPKDNLIADEAAPINHVHQPTPPWLIFYADHDMALRAAENQFFTAALLQAGHRDVTSREITERNHGTVAEWITHPHDPVREGIVAFIQRLGGAEKAK